MNLFHGQGTQATNRGHQQCCGCLVEEHAWGKTQQVEHEFLVTDDLVGASHGRGADGFTDQVDNHVVKDAEE